MEKLGKETAEKLSKEPLRVIGAGRNLEYVVKLPDEMNSQKHNKMNLQKIFVTSKGNDSK